MLTIFRAIVFCAAMALMLISCVAFIQDNMFFSPAPKEASGTGDGGKKVWFQHCEPTAQTVCDLPCGFGAGSVDLHAVLNTEDGMSHNKRRTEEI